MISIEWPKNVAVSWLKIYFASGIFVTGKIHLYFFSFDSLLMFTTNKFICPFVAGANKNQELENSDLVWTKKIESRNGNEVFSAIQDVNIKILRKCSENLFHPHSVFMKRPSILCAPGIVYPLCSM